MEKEKVVEQSSGNVYADLGLPNPEQMLAKAKLVHAIRQAINARGLTQTAAAALLGVDQPRVSKLLKGHFRGFSSDRLFQFLTLLGQDVTITIAAHPTAYGSRGNVTVGVVAETATRHEFRELPD